MDRALDFENDPQQELDFFGPNGLGLDGFFGGAFTALLQ